MAELKPFNRVAVFSGGGSRFVMYCGMYTAMVEHGIRPDLIISTCGATISTCIIRTFNTPEAIKAYLESDEFLTAAMNTFVTNQTRLDRLPYYCIKYSKKKENAPYLLDLFSKYFIDQPQDLDAKFPSLLTANEDAPEVITLGSEILYTTNQVGKKREGQKTFKKVLIPTPKVPLDYLQQYIEEYKFDTNSAVLPDAELLLNVEPLRAMRISTSDMFYMAPAFYRGKHYLGGAVDLIPFELATTLGNEIWLEHKAPYSDMEEGLVRAVFGYSGNKRLNQAATIEANRLDTSDMRVKLSGGYLSRKINWKKFALEIQLPTSKEDCKRQIMKQYDYGYEVVLNALKQ
ncbi:patatin-like phospholipase family protein [Myroides marinus]|uniref:patatin-like phospholipase family protein n=1 Tax=Myroides marinus TaxID=703342 RepID=UPI002575BECB|nr:patatin-like phospholipase family protein [Myroides marinus]MDM1349723.1 patatin-like phospholipase family protein [Myroides marinus]MDM1356932.1 patatin-like phospholipase family protein [Myroides marinus]MDM1379441.1 patatin-like phospholipase family protein [Myroides marinus]MDM1384440.1 patatin-like phospholipase family protein [Myroides marinus]MDM1386617.1 patatin-like phospholipase family protein [Myroides marinus]